ncbi:PH domain-containing protein [Ornithinimicrobium sp. Arc0846-15]|nr:PH domain-containing protein [Ornithinimicrobium laminariae]
MLGSSTVDEAGTKVSSRILKRYLLAGEDIVVATRQHWAKLAEPAITVVVGFLFFAYLGLKIEEALNDPALWLWWGWLFLVGRLLWRLLEWRNEWFVATDKRLLLTYGLFTTKVAMMPLGKVTDMNFGRSITGRILGYGTFTMESAGQEQAMRQISWVPDPDNTYKSIVDTIFGPDHGYDSEDDRDESDHQLHQSTSHPVKPRRSLKRRERASVYTDDGYAEDSDDAEEADPDAPYDGYDDSDEGPQGEDDQWEDEIIADDEGDDVDEDEDITGEIPDVFAADTQAPSPGSDDEGQRATHSGTPVPVDALAEFEDDADDIPEEFPAPDAKAIDLLEDEWRPDSWRESGTRPELESSYEVSGEDTTSFVRVQRDLKPSDRRPW